MSVRSTALDGPETRLPPPEDPPSPRPPAGSLTSPLRAAGYAAVLTALAFIQGAGLMVADTKFDLLVAPGRFLARSLQLWDPHAAFGQVPDQSYGYAWPMGPFFALGHLVDMPPWMIQRLWWALLLCVAFFGMLRLCERLMLGSELTRVVAAFAFVLTPRLTTLVGVVSVEVWPMALAPWVLLPLVRGSKEGSVRRAAAASALVVGCCGGVNAVAVAAVLPARRDLAADPRARPAALAAAGLVDVVHRARDRLVERAAAPARPLRAAVPRLHRERLDHHPADRPDPQPAGRLRLGRLLRWARLRCRPPRRRYAVPPGRRGPRRRARAGRDVPARQPAPQVPGVGPAGRGRCSSASATPATSRASSPPTGCSRSTSPWRRSATSTSSTSSCGSR